MKDYFEKEIKKWKKENIYFEDLLDDSVRQNTIVDKAIDEYFKGFVISSIMNSINFEFTTSIDSIMAAISNNIKNIINKNVVMSNTSKSIRYIEDKLHSYHRCVEGFSVSSASNDIHDTKFMFILDTKVLHQ